MEQTFLVTEAIKEQFDIPVHEVTEAFDEFEAPVILGQNTIEDLKAFAADVGSKVVLVQYDYTDEDELFIDIDDDALEGLFGENAEQAEEIICEHNDAILEEDWDAPYAMSAFVMYEGSAFGIRVFNDAYDGDLLIDPEDFLVCLMDEFDADESEEEDAE